MLIKISEGIADKNTLFVKEKNNPKRDKVNIQKAGLLQLDFIFANKSFTYYLFLIMLLISDKYFL